MLNYIDFLYFWWRSIEDTKHYEKGIGISTRISNENKSQ